MLGIAARRWTAGGLLALGLALGLPLGLALGSSRAYAQSNPPLFFDRALVCRPEGRPPRPAPSSPRVEVELVPLPTGPRPPARRMAELVVIDVAEAEPVPARVAPPRPEPAPPPIQVETSHLDHRCLGFPRGKAGILRVVQAAPGARFGRNVDPHDHRMVRVRAAAVAAYSEVVPSLLRTLERPSPTGSDLAVWEALDEKLHAARALGDLGVSTGGAQLAARLASREDESYSLLWLETLPALARLDPKEAEAYAERVIARVLAGRSPREPQAPEDAAVLRGIVPLLQTPDAARARLLASLPDALASCQILAARVRLGDRALRDALRPELSTDLRTQRAVACYSELMPEVFPGRDPEELPALLHRHRMDSLVALVARGRDAAVHDRTWLDARRTLKKVLTERSQDPDVAGGRGDRRFRSQKRALHLALLAALGDDAAARELRALIRDPSDRGVAPFVGAEAALALDLPGAEDDAAARLSLSTRGSTERFDTQLDPKRGFISVDEHVRLIDALADRRDPRFALGLLDRERDGREAAAYRLVRTRRAGVCDVVAEAADGASEEAVQDGFWALTLLGDDCKEMAFRLAMDAARPPHVRGMALELAAMLRDRRIAPHLGPRRGDDIAPARARAKLVFEAAR